MLENQLAVLILLPRFYNPDARGRRKRVEQEKFKETIEEIIKRFGACLLDDRNTRTGFWVDRGILMEDDIVILEVDTVDDEENRNWFITYAQEVLCVRFGQRGIYVRFFAVEAGVVRSKD
ncbi:MAG: hypothetical protein LAO21_22960 [Acidobacteriia bacterium]|nr:hypothetical protein [Terriglobia bacterium]